MFRTAIIASLAASSAAFSLAPAVRLTSTRLSMAKGEKPKGGLVGSGSAEGLAGQTAPLGFFDPLGLSTGKTDGDIKVCPNVIHFFILGDSISRIFCEDTNKLPTLHINIRRNIARQSLSTVALPWLLSLAFWLARTSIHYLMARSLDLLFINSKIGRAHV